MKTAAIQTEQPIGQRRALAAIAGSQLLVLTLWFSASAVAPQLEEKWQLTAGEATGLTLAVQIGFVVGALASGLLSIADVVPARKLFVVAGLGGALFNGLLLLLGPGQTWIAFFLRLGTGVALAGVYPSGLKVMAGWFRRGRGMALGVLAGALTIGSAGPHLIRGVGFGWQGVIAGASVLALVGTLILGYSSMTAHLRRCPPASRGVKSAVWSATKGFACRLTAIWATCGSCTPCGRGRRLSLLHPLPLPARAMAGCPALLSL